MTAFQRNVKIWICGTVLIINLVRTTPIILLGHISCANHVSNKDHNDNSRQYWICENKCIE